MFISFVKVGLLTFGGGMAMLPLLQREIVETRGWTTEEELTDYFAIAQCTPGIIAVNTATFVGHKQKGAIGGIVAALGVVFPSLVVIVAIAAFLSGFADIPEVQDAFAGVRVCVCVLILNAFVKLFKKNVSGVFGFAVFAAVFAGAYFTRLSPAVFVVLAALAGIIFTKAEGQKE